MTALVAVAHMLCSRHLCVQHNLARKLVKCHQTSFFGCWPTSASAAGWQDFHSTFVQRVESSFWMTTGVAEFLTGSALGSYFDKVPVMVRSPVADSGGPIGLTMSSEVARLPLPVAVASEPVPPSTT